MSKIAEQRALEAYPDTRLYEPSYDDNADGREGYIKGYDQAMQDFLEKACGWLKDNSKNYAVCYEDSYCYYAYNSMIDDFKNYMKDE